MDARIIFDKLRQSGGNVWAAGLASSIPGEGLVQLAGTGDGENNPAVYVPAEANQILSDPQYNPDISGSPFGRAHIQGGSNWTEVGRPFIQRFGTAIAAGEGLGALGAGGEGAASGVGEGTAGGIGIGEGSASTAATGVAPAATTGIGGGDTGLMAGLSGGGAGGSVGTGALEGGGMSDVVAGSGATVAGDASAGTGSGTAMSRILDGTASTADWLSIGGNIAGTGLGIAGARNQANAYRDLNNQYMALGAPSRGRYEASMSPGFDPNSIPGYSGAVDTASKGILARLAASGGNPWGNPGGLIEANKQIISGTALPAIQQYQNQNAATGGYGAFNTAAPAAANAGIGAQGGVYNAIGGGLAGLTNPQPSIYETLARLGIKGLS